MRLGFTANAGASLTFRLGGGGDAGTFAPSPQLLSADMERCLAAAIEALSQVLRGRHDDIALHQQGQVE
jgi:hypothetical protein